MIRVEVGVELDLADFMGIAGQRVLDSESLRFEPGSGAHPRGSPMLRGTDNGSVGQTTLGWRPGREGSRTRCAWAAAWRTDTTSMTRGT